MDPVILPVSSFWILGIFLQLTDSKRMGPDYRLLPGYFPLLVGVLEILALLANSR